MKYNEAIDILELAFVKYERDEPDADEDEPGIEEDEVDYFIELIQQESMPPVIADFEYRGSKWRVKVELDSTGFRFGYFDHVELNPRATTTIEQAIIAVREWVDEER